MTHSNDTRRPQSIEERIRIQLVKWKRRAESYGPRHGEVCFIAEARGNERVWAVQLLPLLPEEGLDGALIVR